MKTVDLIVVGILIATVFLRSKLRRLRSSLQKLQATQFTMDSRLKGGAEFVIQNRNKKNLP